MGKAFRAIFLCALAGLTTGAQAQTAGQEVLNNPGFEGEYRPAIGTGDMASQKARITGRIAEGWSDNSGWADVAVDYAPEKTNPHRGATAQRVAVSRMGGGAVQLVQGVQFRKGRVYDFRVWLRGQPGAGVSLLLRQAGAPYATYGEASAYLSAEWQEFHVWGPAREDTNGFAMVVARAPMTFFVDDAQVRDLTDASTNAPPRVGNLLNGGSFEAGVSYAWSARFEGAIRHAFADPRPRVDAGTAAHGKQSLRLEIPEGDNVQLQSPLFSFNFNRPHTVSLWMKASVPNTGVYLMLEKANVGQGVSVGTEWKRYTFSGTLPYLPYTLLRIQCRAPEGQPRTLWVDGVQVEEGTQASPEYRAPFPLEMTLRLPRPGSVVFDGEKAAVRVSIAPAPPAGARLRLSALDVFGSRYALPEVALPAAALPLPLFRERPRGMFKLRGQVVDRAGRPLSAPVEMVWARLPRPREIDPRKSFFGIHIPLAPEFIAIARATGQRWVRLHDTSMIGKWAAAEPERDHFQFYDEGVTAAHQAGLAILGMLDGAPRWAGTKPREGYWSFWHLPDAPDALPRWENYVRTVAGHYRGRIDHWEVWNEPWGQWFTGVGGPPELYGRLLKGAFQAAKAANPGASVVGIDTYPGNTWTDQALAAAGPESFDAFSFHDYSDALYGGPESPARQHALEMRAAQAKYGTPRPLWDTEGGPGLIGSFYAPETGAIDARRQLTWAVRYDVCYLAAGVKAFFLYAIHSDPFFGETEYRATEHDRAIRPILAARAVLASLVDGAGVPKRTEPVKGVDAYTFPPEKGKSVTVLWSYDANPHAVPVARGARVLDVLGNPLWTAKAGLRVGSEPVYVIR